MITLSSINQSAAQQTETIELVAVINTALCVGAGGSSGSLADKPILKDAQGQLVIPASQLKGRLRHECEKLARALSWPVCESPTAQRMCPQRASQSQELFNTNSYKLKKRPDQTHCLICQIFGNPALPARLQLSDLVCKEPPENLPEVLRPGVSINRQRRTAEDQKLYFLETSPANAGLKFEGSLQLQPPWPLVEGIPAPFAKALVLAGLGHIHALGGGKSTGLGWLQWEFNKDQLEVPQAAWDWLGYAIEEKSTPGGTGQ
jgi:CRISPR/Cas system CSM-associated protein Csm3 (group 7 of RAMP superfamily)